MNKWLTFILPLCILVMLLVLRKEFYHTHTTIRMPEELKSFGNIPFLEQFDEYSRFTVCWTFTEEDLREIEKNGLIARDMGKYESVRIPIKENNNKGIFKGGYMYEEKEIGLIAK